MISASTARSGRGQAIFPPPPENEEKRSYYKVMVRFDANRSDRYTAEWQLKPGMTVDAEIISGSKSLLQYLLKPIYRGVDAAFADAERPLSTRPWRGKTRRGLRR
jgi:HlyD family secretion protein/adhesin transport system membrane fusion protein